MPFLVAVDVIVWEVRRAGRARVFTKHSELKKNNGNSMATPLVMSRPKMSVRYCVGGLAREAIVERDRVG